MTIFNFSAEYGVTQSFQVLGEEKELGDCLDLLGLPTGKIIEESWGLSGTTADQSTVTEISNYRGIDPFLWRLRSPRRVTGISGSIFQWEVSVDDYGEFIADKWDISQIAPSLWKISFSLNKWQHWEIDECSVRESDLTDDYPVFPLHLPGSGAKRSFEIKYLGDRKNGGIEHRTSYGYNATRDTWSFQRTVGDGEREAVNRFLSDRAGNFFRFNLTPENNDGKIYNCRSWSCSYIAPELWQMSFEFKRVHAPFRKSAIKQLIEDYDFAKTATEVRTIFTASVNDTDINQKLNGAIAWLLRWQGDPYPYILNDQWILRNSFHKVLGRGGYFPPSGAPTEAQAVITRASCLAYLATGNVQYLELAVNCGNALLEYFYPLKIPHDWTVEDGIRVPHWLVTTEPFVSKGAIAPDPLNYGFFDLTLNFVNGVAVVPSGNPWYGELLSDVYRVYPTADRLLWQNLFAPPLGGFEWAVDYWTSNVLLEGVVVRYYPESSQPGGRSPTPTTEPPGIIKLKTNYTGQAKIVYAAYVGSIIPRNGVFEPYPCWRTLRTHEALGAIDVFPWAGDAYDLLHSLTGDSKWAAASACNAYTEAIAAQVQNPTAWYKKSDSPSPYAYPGSQAIVVPQGDRVITSSRVFGGDKDQWLRIDIAASAATPNIYPSVEYSNYAVQAKIDADTTILVETGCSQPTEIELILSLSKNPFDFSQYYKRYLAVPGANIPVIASFDPREFILWDTSQNSWNPRIADNSIYTYAGNGGSAAIAKEYLPLDGITTEVMRIDLSTDNSGEYAGAGLVTKGIAPTLIGAIPRLPLKMRIKVSGTGIKLKVTIAEEDYFWNVSEGDWSEIAIGIKDLENNGGENPKSTILQEIEFVANDESTGSVWIAWAGIAPNRFPLDSITYKAVVASRIRTAHTIFLGTFQAVGSPSEQLKYSPGAVPFTVNVEDNGAGGQFVAAWRGAPTTGYQYPAYYVKKGLWDRLRLVIKFLEDAQTAYKEQNINSTFGPFAPTYLWGYWDAVELENGRIDIWTFKGTDPNTQWEGYQIRPAESIAHAWYLLKTGQYSSPPPDIADLTDRAGKIASAFFNWLASFYLRRKSFQPPTDFYPQIDPVVNYRTIHFAAIALRGFIYCNLAGGIPSVTLRGIKASYDFLRCEYINDGGLMDGSFFKNQPNFVYQGMVLKEGFGFWMAEAIEAIALLKMQKNNLKFPNCCIFLKDICP